MTKYNTGNPVGSSSPLDLHDNAENLDAGINGASATWQDRRGVQRRSWTGLEAEYDQFVANNGLKRYQTWSALQADATRPDGFAADVIGDAGTHVDPITGATVSNSGQYRASGGRWQWMRADTLETKADKVQTKLDLASEAASIKQPFDGFALYDVGPDGVIPLLLTMYGGALYPLVWYDVAAQRVIPTDGGSGGGGVADTGRSLGYVLDGALRAATPAGDGLLDDVAARRWVQVQTTNDVARGVFRDGGGGTRAAVVGIGSGEVFPLDRVAIMADNGQSNAPGQAGTSSRSVVYGEFYPYPDRVLMPATAANNVWMGTPTQGGASTELLASSITGLARLRGSIAPTNQHGTIGVEAAARRWSTRAAASCAGYVPKMVVFSVGEGGQAIANMVKSPPAGFFNFANLRTALQRTVDVLALTGERADFSRLNWQMSETDSGDSALGQKTYDLLKSYQTEFYPITGQTVPLRMMASQMSSFRGGGNQAVRSILAKALEVYAQWGDFFCTGPTYPYPFHTDYLHQSSVGHAMQGEFFEAAISQVEKTGHWKPLHMVSAVRSGGTQIVVQLSEPATIDAAWLVAAIENAGITVTGTTVSNVQVTGSQMTLTVADANAATQVNAALVTHPSTGDRAAETIPRSTVRSTTSIGQWSAECGGRQMYKPLCHQFITIGA